MFQMLKGDSQLVHCCATDGHTTPLMFAAKNGKQTHDLLWSPRVFPVLS